MKFRFNILLALAAVGIAFSVATAQAAIVVGLNSIDYTNREQVATYNSTTNTYTATSQIAVGDHLYGINVSTTESPDPAPPTASLAFDLVVAKIIDPSTGASIGAGYTGTAEVLFTTDSATLSGGETGGFLTGSSGATYTLADGSTINGLAASANSLDATFQGSSLTSATLDSGTQAGGITAATNGTLFSDFGLGAALTDTSADSQWGAAGIGYWEADVKFFGGVLQSGTVPFIFGLVPTSPTPPATSYVGLYNELVPLQNSGVETGSDTTSIHNNAGLLPLLPDPTAGTLSSGQVPTTFAAVGGGHAFVNVPGGPVPWPNGSADPYWVDPKAPEPGTMLLVGMGLAFGLPYLRRRQKNAAA